MVQLIFYGSEQSKTDNSELKCFCNTLQQIYIEIKTDNLHKQFICLDKATAIKFSKELRKQIAIISDEESI